MSLIAVLLNVLWMVFGGLWAAIGWCVAAIIMAITIIGIPWARAAFNIGVYTLLPFGFKAVSRDEHLGRGDIGTGVLGPSEIWCGWSWPVGGWPSFTSCLRLCSQSPSSAFPSRGRI